MSSSIFTVLKKEIEIENLRHSYIKRILESFADEIDRCGPFNGSSKSAQRSQLSGTKDGIGAIIERWLLIQELYGANQKDVLIPSNPQKDKWLRREMKEGNLTEEQANELDDKLVDISKQMYSEFEKKVNELSPTDTIDVECTHRDTIVCFYYVLRQGKRGQREVISKQEYNYLRDLFYHTNKDISSTNDNEFHHHLLILMLRYQLTNGAVRGQQMALPETVFNYLKETYHLQHECFASPFNSCPCIHSYCSRFIDTDKYFGSKGSFFNYDIEEGVYESNPPFVEECMIRNIKHILELLQKAEENKKELTFFIIVPKWDEKDCESYNLSVYTTPDRSTEDHNPFFVTLFAINKYNHFYRNGMAFRDTFRVMRAKNDSLIIVLQSSAAKEKMPISESEFNQAIEKRWTLDTEEFIKNEDNSRMPTQLGSRNNYKTSRSNRSYEHNDYDYRSKRRYNNY